MRKLFIFLFGVLFGLLVFVGCKDADPFPKYYLRYDINYCAMLDGVRQDVPNDAWAQDKSYPTEYIYCETPKIDNLIEVYDTTIHSIGAQVICESWYLDAACTQPFEGLSQKNRGAITLYAKLTSNRTEFAVLYYAICDGVKQNVPLDMWQTEKNYPATYKKGETTQIDVLKSTIPTTQKGLKAEIKVESWYLDAACTQAFTGISQTQIGDISLYAKATTNRLEYSIDYYGVLNGEVQSVPQAMWQSEGIYPQVYETGNAYTISDLNKTVALDNQPNGSSILFEGWFLDANCTERFTGILKKTKIDLVLYAKLTQVESLQLYSINYKMVYTKNKELHITDVLPEMFAKDKLYPVEYYKGQSNLFIDNLKTYSIGPNKGITEVYAFKGWYFDEACTQAFTGDTSNFNGDITLYAKVNYAIYMQTV